MEASGWRELSYSEQLDVLVSNAQRNNEHHDEHTRCMQISHVATIFG